jgi:flagella basal body P-ring formation protein FlgA
MAVKRPLRIGQAVRAADLMKPEIVRQNEAVTITYERPGIVLSVRGKALEAGAEGDVINVLNIQSKRTLQTTVTGPGRVSAAALPASVAMSANKPEVAVAAATSSSKAE